MTAKNPRSLREARDDFRELLKIGGKESEWQALLAKHPYIFSNALPVRISADEIVSLGRPGRSEADFVFYPKNIATPWPTYGVIELKRPDTKIVTAPRRNIVTLTRDAASAAAQVKAYAKLLRGELEAKRGHSLALGNPAYLFLIMGLSKDLAGRVPADIEHRLLEDLLPNDLRLIPYDTLLSMFEESLPRFIFTVWPVGTDIPNKTARAEKLQTARAEKLQEIARLERLASDRESWANGMFQDLSYFEAEDDEERERFGKYAEQANEAAAEARKYLEQAVELKAELKESGD